MIRGNRSALGLIGLMSVGTAGCSVAHAQSAPATTATADGGSATTHASADAGAPYLFVHPPVLQNNGYVPELVLRALRHHHDQILDCYRHTLEANPRATRTLRAHVEVIAGGQALLESLSATPDDEPLASCVRNVFSQCAWPNPRTVNADFRLQIDLAPTAPPPARH